MRSLLRRFDRQHPLVARKPDRTERPSETRLARSSSNPDLSRIDVGTSSRRSQSLRSRPPIPSRRKRGQPTTSCSSSGVGLTL